jgi:hypothetical protein
MSDFMKTPVEGDHNMSPKPSGHVETDGKCSTIRDLPTRTMGKDSIPEVTMDCNVDLPEYTKGK